jgi:hypothetical protein
MRTANAAVALGALCASIAWAAVPAAATNLKIPLACSRGPRDQRYSAAITAPASAREGSTYTVRVDGASSGTISQMGLNHIHQMGYDFLVPDGTTFVSARIVPGTGTANVRAGARVTPEAGVVRVVLPGQVDEGTSYTPPGVEVDVKVNAAAGTALVFKLAKFRVTVNALLVGDLDVVCDPTPKPYPMATTTVAAR